MEAVKKNIEKKLKKQKRVFETQMRDLKTVYLHEAIDFIKKKTVDIQSYLTQEHQKLVKRFIDWKERTQDQVNRNVLLERTLYEMTMKEAIEFQTKEAMYAMDSTNPLRLFDCLIPEITAYRPIRILYKEQEQNNYQAKLKLKETQLAIVSCFSKFYERFIIFLNIYKLIELDVYT